MKISEIIMYGIYKKKVCKINSSSKTNTHHKYTQKIVSWSWFSNVLDEISTSSSSADSARHLQKAWTTFWSKPMNSILEKEHFLLIKPWINPSSTYVHEYTCTSLCNYVLSSINLILLNIKLFIFYLQSTSIIYIHT